MKTLVVAGCSRNELSKLILTTRKRSRHNRFKKEACSRCNLTICSVSAEKLYMAWYGSMQLWNSLPLRSFKCVGRNLVFVTIGDRPYETSAYQPYTSLQWRRRHHLTHTASAMDSTALWVPKY